MRLTRDTTAALVSLALSLGMLWLSANLPQSALVPIGPAFYPRIVLGITAVLSVMLIAIDIVKSRRPLPAAAAQATATQPPRNYRLVVIAFIVFGLYVALLSFAGYRIATFLFVAALQPLLEPPRAMRGWIIVLVTATATSYLTFLIFEEYLQVLLPRGSWTGF
jgi:putative tricarboxylic transport membrane protein